MTEPEHTSSDTAVRHFYRRRYRQQRRLWLLILSTLIVVGAGIWLGQLLASLLLVIAGLLIAQLMMLGEMQDMLGFFASIRHNENRLRDHMLREIEAMNRGGD
ncbi:MAG TPA: hypothetical protein VK973_04495 [Arenicellales bacterium]|nr:hypothetical protein [Arenicellales bacterium]